MLTRQREVRYCAPPSGVIKRLRGSMGPYNEVLNAACVRALFRVLLEKEMEAAPTADSNRSLELFPGSDYIF